MNKTLNIIAAMVAVIVFSGPAMAENITIVGTGSGMSVLKAVGDAFNKINPNITIDVPDSIGSGGGIKAVGNDKNIIGRVARPIKEKEKHYDLTYMPVAKMPIVFFANKSAGVTDLSPQQACSIYSGEITNWQDVGGNDGKIRVIRREDGDSSLSVLLKTFPGFSDTTITSRSKTTFNDQETCRSCVDTKNTIAFGTYVNARNYNVDILTINSKSPTDKDYPYYGTLALIYKKKNLTGNVAEFVAFAGSTAAHEAILAAGGVPIN